ncbi:MAG TPA: peptidoglycan DD-metalloendopeptidase family protein [Gaiellaceae bacterium]|nr:peptidoglycan DD-metalloendopeptidase family protein [Gaiellaceae bacterium]
MSMGRRSPLVVVVSMGVPAVAALAIGLALAASAFGQSPVEEKAAVDARIASLRAEIDEARQQEGVLTSQLSAVVAELRAAEAAVAEAQGGVDHVEAELATEQARLEQLTRRLEEQTRRLLRLQEEYRRAVAILEARVRVIYMEEQPDVLSFLVSATSFGEVIDNVEFLSRIGRQDQRIALEVQAAREKAAAERAATRRTRLLQAATVSVISAKAAEARSVRDRLAVSRDTLTSAQSLKTSALGDVRETREEYLAEVEALAAESASLADAIRAAQGGSGSGSGFTGTGVPSAAGFIWPVNGVVVSGFGMRWGRMHEGIDITAPTGTPIWAAAAGTVIWSGWRGGYGNAVVVDHGNGLATLYAHASALLVGVGQQVSQGQAVALVGSTGNSSGPHLHFEVRVNGVAVDPLLYL